MTEAVGLEAESQEFVAETGIDFSFVVIIFEDVTWQVPDAEEAADYHEAIGEPAFPVLSDIYEGALGATPYDGSSLPGTCILTPEMEILECTTGHGMSSLLEAVQEHAESR